jgi:hypothetical protein
LRGYDMRYGETRPPDPDFLPTYKYSVRFLTSSINFISGYNFVKYI